MAPSSTDVVGTTTLITGTSEFMAERTIDAIKVAIGSADADADMSEISSSELGPGAMAEIASPSLFASLRCVVVRTLEGLPDEAVESLLAYVAAPVDDVALVLHHTGGLKGKAVLDKLRKAGVVEVKAQPLKRWELPQWVTGEFRRKHTRVAEGTAAALVDAVGEDMRALVGAVDQLVCDSAGETITEDLVRTYFGGRAEVKGFAVADAALDGDEPRALEQLRWALSAKVDPVLVTSAIATGLRAVARLKSSPRGLREADLSREVGVPPWKLKTVAAQSRSWSSGGLALAIQAAAQADIDVKGAAGDRLWACERLVISVVQAARKGGPASTY